MNIKGAFTYDSVAVVTFEDNSEGKAYLLEEDSKSLPALMDIWSLTLANRKLTKEYKDFLQAKFKAMSQLAANR